MKQNEKMDKVDQFFLKLWKSVGILLFTGIVIFVANKALTRNQIMKEANKAKVEFESRQIELQEKYSLIYVFANSCPACKRFSPKLKMLSDNLGFQVEAISIDGEGNKYFENSGNYSILNKIDVPYIPVLALLNNETGQIKEIALSDISEDAILAGLAKAIVDNEYN